MMHELTVAIADIESKVRRLTVPFDESAVLAEIDQLSKIKKDVQQKSSDFNKVNFFELN